MSLFFTKITTLFAVFEFLNIFHLPTLRKNLRFLCPEIESFLILDKYLSVLGYCKIVGIYLQLVCILSYVPLNAENCMQNVKKVKILLWQFSFLKMIRNVT